MTERKRILATGLVQGVGFRPAVALAARRRRLSGFVRNTRRGAEIEAQGPTDELAAFVAELPSILPAGARLESIALEERPTIADEDGFAILPSDCSGASRFSVPPDLALCPDCEREFLDPNSRRYLYPFISCGSCGPRYSYMDAMPYDRANTTMAAFPLCARCRAEYEDPADRRYHIEGFSCPDCGPRVLGFEEGIDALLAGDVVAIKGIGGYHLACLADEAPALERLRERKKRPRKPLALMFPDLAALERAARLLPEEKDALASAEAPIVLVPKRRFTPAAIAALPERLVAPDNSSIGVFLPYSPLHKAIMMRVSRPLALTSANLPGDPLVIDDEAARQGLRGVASAFISHERKILRRADDGVALFAAGRRLTLRAGRGSAPSPLLIPRDSPSPILALGAELKSTVSVVRGGMLATSPHIGDLEGFRAFEHFRRTVLDMLDYYGVEPELVVVDLHPDYESTRFGQELARSRGIPILGVQHHHAHLLSVLADHGKLGAARIPGGRPSGALGDRSTLGLVLDGTGYGDDGGIWGGELLLAEGPDFSRLASLSRIPLPGGEAAIREPWRIACAMGLLRYRPRGRSEEDSESILRLTADGALCPLTSSCGRLFDAAAAILGFDREVLFEGEAAMWLEALASEARRPIRISGAEPWDGCALLVKLSDLAPDPLGMERGLKAALALGFHLELAENLAEAAAETAVDLGLAELALSGGVFQNRIFLEAILEALERRGLSALVSSRVPVNDGGISTGQAAAGVLALLADSVEAGAGLRATR
jgi:hydrogenase maturation protein HypF